MTNPIVNVYAQDYGWLFEDLKRHFLAAARTGLQVIASTKPLQEADCWIALRTAEAHRSPDPARTVACIHDFSDEPDLYGPAGERRGVREAGALWLCHPDIRVLLARDGVDMDKCTVLERPIGALTAFSPRRCMPPQFTVGWIGRNDPVKRLPVFIGALVRAAAVQSKFEVLLVGQDLEAVAAQITAAGIVVRHYDRQVVPIEECPALYGQMDVLVVTSATEGQPMVLFESIASGVPVISSAVGWAPRFAAAAPDFVRLAESVEEIAAALAEVRSQRDALFARREAMAALVRPWRLEDWVSDVLRLATELAAGGTL